MAALHSAKFGQTSADSSRSWPPSPRSLLFLVSVETMAADRPNIRSQYMLIFIQVISSICFDFGIFVLTMYRISQHCEHYAWMCRDKSQFPSSVQVGNRRITGVRFRNCITYFTVLFL